MRSQKEITKMMSDKQLCEVFEMTTDQRGIESATVRGWLLDEVEERHPEEFYEWLDKNEPDNTLRNYIL